MTEELSLLEAWGEGDSQAGNELFGRYFDNLYRFFGSKVSDGVDDLIQQTFEQCVRYRGTVSQAVSFRAYLFTIARRVLYQQIRKLAAGGLEHAEVSVSRICDLAASVPTVFAEREEQRLLLDALRAIPLEEQILLELHYWEQMSTREIAAALELPQGTIKSRVRRARQRLGDVMTKLSASSALIKSTAGDLDGWAASLREVFADRSKNASS